MPRVLRRSVTWLFLTATLQFGPCEKRARVARFLEAVWLSMRALRSRLVRMSPL